MLSENLKTIRKLKKLTQDNVAEHLNVKRQTYSAYERGVSIPDATTLNKLAKYFNVTTDYLLNNHSNLTSESTNPENINQNNLSNKDAALFLQEELSKIDIDIEDGKELETILRFINSNKEMLKILMDKNKD